MSDEPQNETHGERSEPGLGGLAHALAAHARRRGALGLRRVAALPAPAPRAPGTSPAAGGSPAAPAGGSQAATARPSPTAAGPAAATRAAVQPDAGQDPRPTFGAPAHAAAPPGRDVRRGTPAADAGDGPSPAALAPACKTLGELRDRVAACTACGLARTRTQTVFADGTGSSGILFVGEGPGADEDRAGVPFVGRAGALLTDIITKGMGLARADVAIVNVVKCRPPDNRDPEPDEQEACRPWLERQVELFDPRVIVPLGRHAASAILGVDAPLGRLRGRVHTVGDRSVVPTYHPAYLLRAPHEKKKTWEDIQLAMRAAGIPLPGARPAPP